MQKLINDIQKRIDYNNKEIKMLTKNIEGMPSGQERDELYIFIKCHEAENRAYHKVLHKIKFPNW